MANENEILLKKYYGRFDAQGKPQGFWVDDIYLPKEDGSRNDAIPVEASEITEAAWTALLADQARARYVGGTVTHIELSPPPPPENPTLVEAQRANARLDAGLAASVATIEDVRDTLHEMPTQFNAQVFAALQLQIKILADTLVAMLQGQASMPPPAAPP